MKTTFDINNILFPTLNTALVLDTLDGGRVYRNKKPLNSELQDIVIIPLSNYNGDEIVNDATFMINCYCKNFNNGTPDITKLKATTDEVAKAIETYNAENNYCVFDIMNQILLNDFDQKSMSYVNLRISCFIEK